MATIDLYAVLELPVTATDDDVRKAYRRLAVRWHPDKNPEDLLNAERRFKEVRTTPARSRKQQVLTFRIARNRWQRRMKCCATL
jgi:preprotein translocase subunit Sec63